ncbi:MAG: hypothetical protein J1F64_04415 [Oscillospiraceae bacterium]|nr:hypothetical protein [Oscillospiraceae bacterium]
MREYITIIAGAAVLSVLADIISPETWKKYIKIVTGIVISCVIIQPAAQIRSINIFTGFEEDFEAEEYNAAEKVADTLCVNIQKDIKERIFEKTGIKTECDVKLSINDDGLIESVDKIYIYGNIGDEMRKELAYIYGVEIWEVVIYGE